MRTVFGNNTGSLSADGMALCGDLTGKERIERDRMRQKETVLRGTGGTEVCFRTEGKVRMLLWRGGSGAYLTKREYARLRSEASEDLPGSV